MRVSALRFWEQQGLLTPQRALESGYRLYDETQMRRLRVVVLLRKAGYSFDAIHATLEELASEAPDRAVAAAERKLSELARRSRDCMEAIAMLHAYLKEYHQAGYEGL